MQSLINHPSISRVSSESLKPISLSCQSSPQSSMVNLYSLDIIFPKGSSRSSSPIASQSKPVSVTPTIAHAHIFSYVLNSTCQYIPILQISTYHVGIGTALYIVITMYIFTLCIYMYMWDE